MARPKVVHCVMRVGHIRGELQYPVVMAQRLHGQRRLTRLNLLKLSIMCVLVVPRATAMLYKVLPHTQK